MPRAQRERWRMKCRTRSGTAVNAERARLVLDDPAGVHQRPGEDDVLADRVRPAADRAHVLDPVSGERPLGDQRAVVRGLHALDAVDPEPVVPALHPAEQVVRRRSRRPALRRTRRRAGPAGGWRRAPIRYVSASRMQERVGVDGHDERCRHALERPVQRAVLARPRARRRAGSSAHAAAPPPRRARRCGRSSCCRRGRPRAGPRSRGAATRSSVGPIAASSFQAATITVTGGHWPSGQGPRADPGDGDAVADRAAA